MPQAIVIFYHTIWLKSGQFLRKGHFAMRWTNLNHAFGACSRFKPCDWALSYRQLMPLKKADC